MANISHFYPLIDFPFSDMHILILPSWYFPADSPEIAGRMFHQHALALQNAGAEARILSIERSAGSPLMKQYRFATEEGVPTIRIRQWFPPKRIPFLLSIWVQQCAKDIHQYIRVHGRPDIIHAQSYIAASICAEVNRTTRIPFVYTERLSAFITGKIPAMHIPFIQNAMGAAAAITCVSPGLEQVLQTYTSKPLKVIPNFFDRQVFYHDDQILKKPVFTFVSIGEPAHIKGLDLLLPAFARVKAMHPDRDVQLILVDQIAEKKSLLQLADDLGIRNHLIWTGLIDQHDVGQLLRESHVLVSASRVETFGKAILEAQACGLPVVATQTDGATFIVRSADQGELTPLEDIDGLSNAMAKVMNGYAQYQAASIHEQAELRFGQKCIVDQWLNLYTSITA